MGSTIFTAHNHCMGNYILSTGDHLFFFIFGLLIPALSIQQGKPNFKDEVFTTDSKIRLYYTNGLAMWIGVFFIALIWFFNDRTLDLLGFRLPAVNSLVIVFSFVLMSAYFIDLFIETNIPSRRKKSAQEWSENTPFLPANFLEYKHFIFAAFTAAFCEEVIFRGFFMNYIFSFSGTSTIGLMTALILPSLLFGVMHIYQGHVAIIKIVIGGILFGLIYYYSQSLLIGIIVHFIIDLIAGWVSIKISKELKLEELPVSMDDE